MNGSQLAIAGGVFVAVLAACFAVVGFGAKGEATAQPDAVATLPPANPADVPPPEPPLPAPKPPAVALGGFGLVARLERGYDGTVGLTRSSSGENGRAAPGTPGAPPTDSDTDPAPVPKKADAGLTDS